MLILNSCLNRGFQNWLVYLFPLKYYIDIILEDYWKKKKTRVNPFCFPCSSRPWHRPSHKQRLRDPGHLRLRPHRGQQLGRALSAGRRAPPPHPGSPAQRRAPPAGRTRRVPEQRVGYPGAQPPDGKRDGRAHQLSRAERGVRKILFISLPDPTFRNFRALKYVDRHILFIGSFWGYKIDNCLLGQA